MLTAAVHLADTLLCFACKDTSQGLAKLQVFASHLPGLAVRALGIAPTALRFLRIEKASVEEAFS